MGWVFKRGNKEKRKWEGKGGKSVLREGKRMGKMDGVWKWTGIRIMALFVREMITEM